MHPERFSRLVLFVALVLAAAAPADGGKLSADRSGIDKLSVTLTIEEAVHYVWRGVLNDDQESLQPSLTLSFEVSETTTVELGGWWNLALDDHGSPYHEDLLFEENYTLSLSHVLNEKTGLRAGYIYYCNPHAGRVPGFETYQTDELFVGIRLTFGRFFFDTTLYADVGKVDGFYLDVSQGFALPLGARLTFEPSLHLGLASGFDPNPDAPGEAFWYQADGLVDGNVTLRLSYAFSERFMIGVFGAYSQRFDDYEAVTGNDETYSWLGLSLGLTY